MTISFGDNNSPIYGTLVTLAPSATRTANGSSGTTPMAQATTLRLTLAVTAASGTTPTLAVAVQHSPDGVTWTNHSSFATATGVGSERKVFAGLDRFVRVAWTVGGTAPSFIFGVSGEAL